MAPAPRPAEISSNISRAFTIPIACIRPWAISAQPSLSVWRPNPVHFFGGRSVHHIVLEDYIAAVEGAEARRNRLTAQIEAMLPDWTLAPVVAALQTMRGMALVNAATLIA